MYISDRLHGLKEKAPTLIRKESDLLNVEKINSLGSFIRANMAGGDEWPIESLCIETGCMRLDISGQIDLAHIGEVLSIIDADGCVHDVDVFYNDYANPELMEGE